MEGSSGSGQLQGQVGRRLLKSWRKQAPGELLKLCGAPDHGALEVRWSVTTLHPAGDFARPKGRISLWGCGRPMRSNRVADAPAILQLQDGCFKLGVASIQSVWDCRQRCQDVNASRVRPQDTKGKASWGDQPRASIANASWFDLPPDVTKNEPWAEQKHNVIGNASWVKQPQAATADVFQTKR